MARRQARHTAYLEYWQLYHGQPLEAPEELLSVPANSSENCARISA
ncbi:MAG: hypothetical protein HY519_04590 [Candidatus Aenigmarchaeota archaeon]|nr:hypothetical protein [Candidatus Aenigmarchaeota archaeon]